MNMRLTVVCLAAIASAGCAAGRGGGAGDLAPQYVDPSTAVRGISGIGFESQDIKEMTDRMVRDLLRMPAFGNATSAPRVIIDDTRFLNESNQVVNLNLLLDRLRIELMRASEGKIQFVSRQNVDLVERERLLKSNGTVDARSSDHKSSVAGAEFQLVGKITSQTSTSNGSGVKSNYYQFSFEMLDLRTSVSVWGNLYEVKKAGADDRIYRQ
ncbi:MAG: penicillin-binding protein activator LpoB [Gemmatimonadota bacterium]